VVEDEINVFQKRQSSRQSSLSFGEGTRCFIPLLWRGNEGEVKQKCPDVSARTLNFLNIDTIIN